MKKIICCFFLSIQIVFMKEFRCDYSYSKEVDGWVKLHEMPVSWEEAKLICYYEGASLASPTTEHMLDIMARFAANSTSLGKVFTGIHRTYSKGAFASIEGVPLSNITHRWAKGEPNALNGKEDCLILNKDGQFEDANCNMNLPHMCFKKYKEMTMTECGTVDKRYILDNRTGSCYKFHDSFHTWPKAKMICNAEGGHLAIINSVTEAQVIGEIFRKYPQNSNDAIPKKAAAIGFHDWDNHSEWVTVHGQSLLEAGYNVFDKERALYFGDEATCGGVHYGGLQDIVCYFEYTFICEKDPKSLHC